MIISPCGHRVIILYCEPYKPTSISFQDAPSLPDTIIYLYLEGYIKVLKNLCSFFMHRDHHSGSLMIKGSYHWYKILQSFIRLITA